ncbi:cytochrome C oxidase assembly protein [Porphyromonas crevioricanis]|uniref:cytochrome d ubiquinol oxidase subunit II n=1 Tax=Porphyromonas crevioricanis TaxID=393921 RepID=UPI00052CB4B1|nr:cytochrome d ubiquinol oxidase subunit II [Porphyromonas crevioricanis]KGN90286.1 cytochrome C oxidase assembly protein [Porphyromonas crevioricanis]
MDANTYSLLQHYWWFLISLLGALLVFLLFVQGGQSFLFSLGKDKITQRMMVNSTGRKWEFTFTTLVTFGGAFFASFPLFYSTSFGGAYWVWMLILLCFVLQAVSYEYQHKHGNVWGSRTYQIFLFINGVLAPILLGAAVSTLFTGGNFLVEKSNIFSLGAAGPTISQWQPYHGVQLHGLEAILNPWNLVLGLTVFFLSRVSALLYFINNIDDNDLFHAAKRRLWFNAGAFLILFLAYVGYLLTAPGYTYDASGLISPEANKYRNNLITLWPVFILFLTGVLLVLFGIFATLLRKAYKKGIWFEGVGVVLTILALLLIAGWNNTAYYPSLFNMQSSLTIANSSSSPFTLKVMSYVSILIPFVLAYIVYTWRAIDLHKIDRDEMTQGGHIY